MPTEGTARLQRRLGVSDAVVIGLGSMVGAGVFAVWGPAAATAGGALLIGLLVAGGGVLQRHVVGSTGGQHPESGGTYVYARARLGPAWGHLAGWGFVVGKTASCAAMALAVGSYLWPSQARLTVAVAAVVGILAVNLLGLSRTVTVTKFLLVVSRWDVGTGDRPRDGLAVPPTSDVSTSPGSGCGTCSVRPA
jgi:basic amino acid/polyamine antiporter, APA family